MTELRESPAPSAVAPIVGIDTHAHIFERGLPLVSGRRYTLDYDATEADYLAHLDAAGLSHGVLVQPSFLGTDNGYMIAALRRHPGKLHGIAAVDPEIGDAALDAMDAAGVVGIRLNLIGLPIPDCRAEPWAGLFRRLSERDWVVEIHRAAADVSQVAMPLLEYGVRVVIDHYGRPNPVLGAEDAGFRAMLDLARTGRVWVKLSAPYRAEADAETEARMSSLLRAAFGPSRLLWGSDWPHTQFEARASYDAEFAALARRVPDAAERRRVLVDTPARLYRFA